MKSLLIILTVAMSLNVFAQTRRVLPLPPPDMTCLSQDRAWNLLINLNLGIIRVVDVAQGSLSHKITGLVNTSSGSMTRLMNAQNTDLPKGLVFEANLRIPRDNAFSINDLSGGRTIYTCRIRTN